MVAVRKTITVVFADLAGSTALGERLDAEPLRLVMGRYFDEARAALERHGGTVEKFIGDAVMAAFGIPTLHEDDALRGIKAAEELRSRLSALNEELEAEWGVRLEVRIAVNTGEVVAGDAREKQAFATGDAVNVAARLEEAAAPGEILIGPETYSLVREAVRVEAVEPLALKGKAKNVRAWKLVEVIHEVPAFQRPLETPFIGRERELPELEAAFERAVATGTCQLASVLGPPGVGKSRLARELLSSLGARAKVVVGRCLPYGEGITYWPLGEIVKQVGGGELAAFDEVIAGEEGADRIVTGIAGAVGLGESTARTQDIFWAVRKLLEALAREQPLVAIVDDIHWAEPTFLDLLEYVANFGRAPILLLCLARADLLDGRPAWAAPKENATLLTLQPLSHSEADALIDNLLSGADVSERLRKSILAAAEGNPLFVEQMLALARESEGGDELVVPPTIQALLAARLDRLEPGERAVIERASVEGRLFHGGAVSALISEDESQGLSTQLMALIRKELIRPDRSEFEGEDGFRFAHTLIRDAAYGAIPKGLRADLHRRFADWVEGKSAELEEIVGYHLEQAVRLRSELGALAEEDRELGRRAAAHLGSAGRRAFRRGDMPAAANLLERAATLLPLDASERLELLIELGSALGDVGELGRAEAVLQEAIERAAEDERLESRALLQRSFLHRYTRPEAGGEELLAAAEHAIRVFDRTGDDAGLSRAWRLVAEVHWTRCQIARMESALEDAQKHACRAGEQHEALLILDGFARAAVAGPTPVDEGIRRCEEIEAQGAARRTLQAAVAAMRGYLKAMRGEFEDARALSAGSSGILEELGEVIYLAALRAWTGEIEMLAGKAAAAEGLRRSGYETLEALGEKGILSTVAAYLAETLYAQGRYEEALRFTTISENAAAPDDMTSQILWRATRAKACVRRGEAAKAEGLAREAVALAEKTDCLNLHGDALISLAETLAAKGEVDEAAVASREALALYEAKGNGVSAAHARARLEGDAPTAEAAPADRAP